MKTYHPDPEINEELILEMARAEKEDMRAGFPPKWWECPTCETRHNRGHFNACIGVHRCLKCGYVGEEGVMAVTTEELDNWNNL